VSYCEAPPPAAPRWRGSGAAAAAAPLGALPAAQRALEHPGFYAPYVMAVTDAGTPASGFFAVTDTFNYRIRTIDPVKPSRYS